MSRTSLSVILQKGTPQDVLDFFGELGPFGKKLEPEEWENAKGAVERSLVAQNENTAALLPYLTEQASDLILNDLFYFPAFVLLKHLKDSFYKKNQSNVEDLLKKPASFLLTDAEGTSALMLAADEQKTKIFALLLQNGADLSHVNVKQQSVFSILSTSNKVEEMTDEVLTHLVSQQSSGQEPSDMVKKALRDLFFQALISEREEMATKLKKWASEGLIEEMKKAIAKKSISLVEKLIEMGADLSWLDEKGQNWSHHARSIGAGGMMGILSYHMYQQKNG